MISGSSRRRTARRVIALGLSCLCPALSAPITILRIGDSITRGYCIDGEGVYFNDLMVNAGIEWTALGTQDCQCCSSPVPTPYACSEAVNATTIGWFIAMPVVRVFNDFQPDFVFLMYGANDMAEQFSGWSTIETNFETMLDEIESRGPAHMHVIVSTVTYVNKPDTAYSHMQNGRVDYLNADIVRPGVQARIDAGKRFSLVDGNAAIDPLTDLADGVHPNTAGSQKLNSMWFAGLQMVSATPTARQQPKYSMRAQQAGNRSASICDLQGREIGAEARGALRKGIALRCEGGRIGRIMVEGQ